MNRLLAVSGFGAKSPACFLAEMAGRRLLLDLGAGPDVGVRPDVSAVGPVDAILISHGHGDHVGALDLAAELGEPPIYASEPVRHLAADPRLKAARPLPLAGAAEICGLAVQTGPAGHAPGAVWMRIDGAGGLLYTGDYCAEGRLYRATPPLPARAMVFDASYGTADVPLAEQAQALAEAAAAGAGRPLLLPAPPAGRGLEMALHLSAAGHGLALCPAHRRVAQALITRPDGLRPGAGAALAALLAQSEPLDAACAPLPPGRVMIAAAADAAGGLAAPLAERVLRDGGQVIFTGHLAAGTPAESLVAAGRAAFLRWNVHPRLAGLRDLLAAAAPAIAMPAFLEPDAAARLAAALPATTFAGGPQMRW